VGLAELFGFGPILEIGVSVPNSVRGIKYVVLALGTLEEIKRNETVQFVQIAFATHPELLEGSF
jgi:hypothetical protein